jgi:hypothetical protein
VWVFRQFRRYGGGANLAKLWLACCCRASRERRRRKRSAPPHSCTLRRCAAAAAPVVLFCLRFSYWVVPISCYACALPSALSLSLRSRFCPTRFDAVLLLFRCSVVKGRERETETEREKPALCCCGATGRGCHLSFVGSVSLGFLFVSCVVCCFYDSCFFATGSSICCSTRLGL